MNPARIFHTLHETPAERSAGLQPALGERTRKAGYKPALRAVEWEISGLAVMPFGNSARRKSRKIRGFSHDSIPKGLHHSAQGCRACEATLGYGSGTCFNPERVASDPGGDDATPLGLMDNSIRLPRVARSSQPWAERSNPLGLLIWNSRKALGLGRLPIKSSSSFVLVLEIKNAESRTRMRMKTQMNDLTNAQMTNVECRMEFQSLFSHSSFVIRHSSFSPRSSVVDQNRQ